MTENVDNSLLVALLRDIRKEQADQRTLLLNLVDYTRKMEQRIEARFTVLESRITGLEARLVAFRDDLELMLKSELMGRLTHFETQIDHRLAELESRS